MHWVYVLLFKDEDDEVKYYVGETRRLQSRFREHQSEKDVVRLFALYKLPNDVLWKYGFNIENECRGMEQCNKKYACQLEKEMNAQISNSRRKTSISNWNYKSCDVYRPMCNCTYKIPAEIFQCRSTRNRGRFYFSCAKKNMQGDWLENVSPFIFDSEACDFFKWADAPKAIEISSQTYKPALHFDKLLIQN